MSLETLERRVSALEARVIGTQQATLYAPTVVIGTLEWAKATSVDRLAFKDAEAYCKALRTNGHDDWRLPTIQELLSLVDYTRHDPAIDITQFPDTKPTWYWSSSPGASAPADYAWLVDFDDGHSDGGHRGHPAFVRAVRSVVPASQ